MTNGGQVVLHGCLEKRFFFELPVIEIGASLGMRLEGQNCLPVHERGLDNAFAADVAAESEG